MVTLIAIGIALLAGFMFLRAVTQKLWIISGNADYELVRDGYLKAGCENFRKGRAAWLWRLIQRQSFHTHYVAPQKIITNFRVKYPHITPGAFLRITTDGRYRLTKPGSIVFVTGVNLDERLLRDPNSHFMPPQALCLLADERGYIRIEESVAIWCKDLKVLNSKEQARITAAYQKPVETLPPFADGQIVEVLADSILMSERVVGFGMREIQSWHVHETIKGIVDIPDSQHGSSVNDINQSSLKPPAVEFDTGWFVYNFPTRAISKKGVKRHSVRRILCGPEYQVFLPQHKIHITVDRADIRKREYDREMLDRVVLDEDIRKKILAWAPPRDPQKLASWGVGSNLLQEKSNIMLFSGPLGSGKTLLAEALAEYLEMPFYPFDSSDLGSSPSGLEEGLKKVGARAKRWNALVLWDEPEIYIENRNEGGWGSHAFVAVSLQYLESFKGGMLVIATNRPFTIDEGINSRIPVKIVFPAASPEKREKVWRAHLPSQMPFEPELSEKDLKLLSQIPLDGRQIRNAVVLAARRTAAEGLHAIPIHYLFDAAEQVRRDAKELREIKPEDWGKGRIGYKTEHKPG